MAEDKNSQTRIVAVRHHIARQPMFPLSCAAVPPRTWQKKNTARQFQLPRSDF